MMPHLHGHVPLLADISEEPPARRSAGVQRQAPAAGHCNVHAIAGDGRMRERPICANVHCRGPQMLHGQAGRLLPAVAVGVAVACHGQVWKHKPLPI